MTGQKFIWLQMIFCEHWLLGCSSPMVGTSNEMMIICTSRPHNGIGLWIKVESIEGVHLHFSGFRPLDGWFWEVKYILLSILCMLCTAAFVQASISFNLGCWFCLSLVFIYKELTINNFMSVIVHCWKGNNVESIILLKTKERFQPSNCLWGVILFTSVIWVCNYYMWTFKGCCIKCNGILPLFTRKHCSEVNACLIYFKAVNHEEAAGNRKAHVIYMFMFQKLSLSQFRLLVEVLHKLATSVSAIPFLLLETLSKREAAAKASPISLSLHSFCSHWGPHLPTFSVSNLHPLVYTLWYPIP